MPLNMPAININASDKIFTSASEKSKNEKHIETTDNTSALSCLIPVLCSLLVK